MLGTYPIGGPNAPPPSPDLSPPGLGQQGQGEMPTQPLPQGMFAAPPSQHHFNWGAALSAYVQNLAAGFGNPAAQSALAAQEQHRQARLEAQRQMMAPQHVGDSLVQMGQDGQYHTLWSAPSDDTPKKTPIQQEAEYYRSIGRPDLAELRLQNFADPVHMDTVVDQSTGIPRMVAVDRNGPVNQQGNGPTPTHIAALIHHPERAAEFDAKFGPGSAARILNQGGPGPSGPATFP